MFFQISLSTTGQISWESLCYQVALQRHYQCICSLPKAADRLCVSIAFPVCQRLFQSNVQDNVCSVISLHCLDLWFGSMSHTEMVWLRWICVWESLSSNTQSAHPNHFYNKLKQVMRAGIVWHSVHKTTQDFSQHVGLSICCLAS